MNYGKFSATISGMNDQAKPNKNNDGVMAFLVHLGIFIVVNIALLFVPVFFDGKVVFDFSGREAMFYGSIGWGIGLVIHGIIVLVTRIIKQTKK